MKIRLLLFLTMLFSVGSWGQVSIYSDNFGVSAVNPLVRTGYTANAASGVAWELRTSGASTTYTWTSPAASFSGGANVFTNLGTNTNVKTLTYDNSLSTIGYTAINVRFGALKSGTVPNLDVSYSVDGTIYNSAGSVTLNTGWTANSIALPVGAEGVSNLRIRFSIVANSNSANFFRIDDFQLIGTPSSSNTITTNTTLTGNPYCVSASTGAAVSIPFTSTGTFTGTNVYTAQLSNAAGSFAAPITIGTLSSTANTGTITATIPAGTVSGTGYRIRVISDTPAIIGTDNTVNLTINLATNSVAPTTTQNLATGANGSALTVTEGSTPVSRQWYYGTVSGGPYGTAIGGATGASYMPNFGSVGTYYVVCISTFACATITSGQVQINVVSAPGNDLCASAVALTINAGNTAGTLLNATATPANTFTYQSAKNDVWYKFTPICTGSHTVTLTFPSAVSDDIDMDIFSAGCPTTGTASFTAHGSTVTETITSTFTGGTTYYIRVIDFSTTGSTMNIQVTGNIAAPSQPGAITGSASICSGAAQTYSVTAVSGATSYTWTLPSGWSGTSTTNSINATASSTSGNVQVTANNGCGSSTAQTLAITVISTATPVGSISATPICGSTGLNFSGTAIAPEIYYWQTSATGTATANPTTAPYNVSSGGTYYVRTYDGTCWSAGTVSSAVTVNAVPTVPTTGNPAAVCEGSAVTFTGTGSSGATSYTFWDAASGGTKYLNGVSGYTITGTALTTPTALTSGTYTYYIQGETASCVSAARKSVTVTINAIPANPAGTISASANPSCGAATLTYSAPSATLYWQTTAGGTSTTNATTSTYNAASTGTYYVRSYNGSCWSTGTVSLAITVNAVVNIAAQPANQAVVVGNIATFNVTATGATSYQWQVSTNGGSTWSNVGTNSNSYTTAATTLGMNAYQYQVLVSGTAPCATVTSTAAILTVNTAPCLSENFAVNALPSGWASTAATFSSNYAAFVSATGDLATIAVSNPSSMTFTLERSSNNATDKSMLVEVSTTTQTTGFTTLATYIDGNTTSAGITNCTVDLSSYTANSTVYIRFRKTGTTTSYWRVDDINVYCGGTTPTITLTPVTLTGMTYVFGAGPSANQTFTASGVNLTADILLTPPTDYEISTAAGSGFGSAITLTQTAGIVNATTIYTRLKTGLAVNTYNTENIAGTSTGATTKNVVCSGSVTVAAPVNNLCGSATSLTVNAAATAGNMTGSTVTAPFTVEKDVWYSFTPTCTGIHAITVTGFSGDIDIELFGGSCPATTTILDGSAGTTSTETISTSLTSGTTYYLRVLAYNAAAETTAFTAQVVSTSVLTLTNAGSPATGNIPAGTANAVIMGFTTTPTCATSYDLTAVTLTKSAISTVTTADISGFRIFYDANSNGIVDGAEASVSGAGIALATTMSFTLTGQTGITTARKYLLVANILAGAVNGNTIKVNLSPNTDLTSVLTPSGTKTGTALGSTQTITPPACTSAVIATITPTSGPVGTEVTITASSGNLTGATATFNGVAATVVSSSATQLIVKVPTGATTGNLVVTDGQPCNVTTAFTVINNDITTCQGAGNSFTDLIISEVYDSVAGNVWHMELFNPTNAPINLDAVGANYKIERYGTIGDAAPTRTIDISGIIQPGAVYLADLGTITDPSCIKTFDFTSYAQGINEQDAIKLTKENVSVDIVHCPNEKGYTITRNTTASGPNPVFNGADWNTNSTESCTDLGLFSATLNVPPTITAQPSINLTCTSTSAAVAVTATEGFAGGNPLAYQWYVAAPGAATWTALTNTGVYTGTTTSVLNISSVAGLDNYQYYCQVRENGANCYKASIAVKIPAGTGTTWNGSAWSNGTPTLGMLTIINGDYNTTTNGDIDACSLIVKAGFTATVTATHYINIQNDLTVEAGGTLDVLNNGSLVQVSDTGVNTGTILMKRTANIRLYDYVYWSAPVANFPVASVSPSSPTGNIFKWNPTVANSNGGFGNWENTVENMVTAKGYIVRGPTGFNNAAPQAMTANFSGVPNNGIYTPSILRGNNTAADYPGTNGITITNKEDNWNLIGNPYPSAIKSIDFLAANTNIEGAVRLWTHGTLPNAGTPNPFYGSYAYNYTATDYIVHNGTATTSGPVGFNGLIGAGQSFLVLMNDGAAATQTVTFNNALRSKTYDNSQFYRNANSQNAVGGIEQNRIWLDLISSTNVINRAVVGYVEGATDQKDRMYDAYTDYKNAQNFYSIINDDVVIIQGKSLPFKVEDRVPMGIKIPSNGTYQIAIAAADGIFAAGGQTIYLEDLLLNVIHNLSAAPYQFTTVTGIINNRFVLRYTDAALGNDSFEIVENGVTVATENHEINIKSQLEQMKNISVYDVLGRQVFEKNNINTTAFTIQNLVVSQQALIVKIILENGQTVSKKIVF
ncbi:T9SS sorting signal type C domain-containing protein [Flavobacterium sp. GT3R68]|uniref:T9SS sorting signal type C domain-containing protein n=1 Tax=Flavobacterium sp. GT3R68 TaxID=2594437 RepID=UPI000F898314|nr:T9SS sorting signal type C domain-containing protein [Flavobacterium sp. GT3R68]RTY90873.1 T9SS sorting signal type C domain-containing protein [Flavobacterium sp. GSN2]TRW93865.1 T9SS sorting signal type C domain-containing protein [Flavobacterium sp. GT3R68]